MGQVILKGMEFFAYHGYSYEEQKVGNKYSVDIKITTDTTKAAETDELQYTVNYEKLYKVISDQMKISSHLLEHLANRIIKKAFEKFPFVDDIEVCICKYNPSVSGLCKAAKVIISRSKK